MEIKLSTEDLKGLEDTFTRALVRAARTLARQGIFGKEAWNAVVASDRPAPQPLTPVELIPEPVAPVAEAPPLAAASVVEAPAPEPPPPPAPEPPVNAEPPPLPRFAWPPPPVERVLTRAEIERLPVANEKPAQTKKPRRVHRSARDLVRTVGDRPDGYITTEDASKYVARDESISDDESRTIVRRWIYDREVLALIVANVKPPTKGLPGRLHVEKRSLEARDKLRLNNKKLAPKLRGSAPKVHDSSSRYNAAGH